MKNSKRLTDEQINKIREILEKTLIIEGNEDKKVIKPVEKPISPDDIVDDFI